MIHYDITQEDTRLLATMDQMGTWDVKLIDSFSGQERQLTWTETEMAAILTIIARPDKTSPADYEVAEVALATVPANMRPIP